MSAGESARTPIGHLHIGSASRLSLPRGAGESLVLEIPRTGGMLRWFADHFADSDQSIAVVEGATVFDIMDEKAASAPPGCDGLICVPAQEGQSGEDPLPAGRGAFMNLSPDHGRYHLYRSILEGCAYELRRLLERARTGGERVDALTAEGPGARSRLWMQIHADICGLPIEAATTFLPDPARRDIYERSYQAYLRAVEIVRA
jgi:sugar (pentulose or hexulose) kinase